VHLDQREIRIAVCDDHPLFRTGIRTLLAGAPDLRLVFEAESIASLRIALASTPTDLLLLDMELPDGSGLDELAACLQRTRVLVISALADPSSVRCALSEGASGFLRKDSSADEVLRSIRRAAAGQTALSADVALVVAEAMRANPESASFRRRLTRLTPRQREVLALLAEGRSNREIGNALFVSEGTIKNHVSQILDLLGVRDRTRLAVLVAKHGLGP
jgi:DNA-binding NarL/FixJ family response regulator